MEGPGPLKEHRPLGVDPGHQVLDLEEEGGGRHCQTHFFKREQPAFNDWLA